MKASEFTERIKALMEVIGGDPDVVIGLGQIKTGGYLYEVASAETQNCSQLNEQFFQDYDQTNNTIVIKVF